MSQDIYKSPSSNLQDDTEESYSITITELLFSFQGRIGRAKFWAGTLGVMAVLYGVIIILSVIGLDESVVGVVVLVLYIPVLWISLAVQVKRWHDRNKSGWWVLIGFIPLIGSIWVLIENGCLAGDDGVNNYGPPCR